MYIGMNALLILGKACNLDQTGSIDYHPFLGSTIANDFSQWSVAQAGASNENFC
jgi:hypothetical protein